MENQLILRVLVAPKEKITFLYYKQDNIFTTKLEDAHIFNSRGEAMEIQNKFNDLECEIVNVNKIKTQK